MGEDQPRESPQEDADVRNGDAESVFAAWSGAHTSRLICTKCNAVTLHTFGRIHFVPLSNTDPQERAKHRHGDWTCVRCQNVKYAKVPTGYMKTVFAVMINQRWKFEKVVLPDGTEITLTDT